MSRLGIVHHPIYQEHDAGSFHPESPRRLKAIEDELAGELKGLFEDIEPRQATAEEITWVHHPEYFELIASTAGRGHTMLDGDTSTSPRSFEAALMAAGGLLNLVQAAFEGRIEAGWALVRPPGHHAEANRAMGFCLFNNVAVAACYGLERLGLKRILIADWDLHHGNGTQHSFEAEDRVLYFSTHQYPYYPGSGHVREVGRGRGEGFTVNVPISYGHGDEEFVQIFSRVLGPVAASYQPELILVSAGFDTLAGDPLGAQSMTPRGYAALARFLDELAGRLCPGRLIFTLEGGYDIKGQAQSVAAVIKELAGVGFLAPDELRDDESQSDIAAVAEVKKVHGRYWPCLKE